MSKVLPARTVQREALINIQYLRAIAAMMVVWAHAREQFDWIKLQFPSAAGGSGVDLFFVISGFIMVYTTFGRPISPTTFFARRLARIGPLYWLATLAIVVVVMLAPSVFKSTTVNAPHVWASLAFIPMLSPIFPGQMWPLLVPGWTLNYEMAFYVLFAATLLAPLRFRTLFLVGTLVLLVWAGIYFRFTGVFQFYTDAIVLTFGTGAILGHLYCSNRLPKSVFLGLTLVLGGSALWLSTLSINMGHRAIGSGIPAFLIVMGACILPSFDKGWLNWLGKLGDASYSIYVGHIFLLGLLRVGWAHTVGAGQTEKQGMAFMLTSVVFCAVGGVLIYYFIEKILGKLVSKNFLIKSIFQNEK
jgi:exopolysaccharide production protein ExoZ